MTEKGKQLIKKYEGCSLVAYKCPANKYTIGWGSTTYADGTPVQEGDKIDQATANQLFDVMIEKFEKQTRLILGDTLCATLSKEAIDALISFAYNCGTNALAKSTLLKRIKESKTNLEEIEKQWLRWNKAGGKELAGLTRRRKEEFKMYKEAVLSAYTKVECYEIGKGNKQ